METGSVEKNGRRLLSANVKKHRVRMGISQEDLGVRCGFHRTYISRIERLETAASVDSVTRLALGLGTTIKDLFDDSEPLAIAEQDGR